MTRPTGVYPLPHTAPRRVHDSEYFDRYFAFCIPVRDVKDADVRADLTHQVQAGE
ncbi:MULTISPECIES: hypothetical protein [Rhodococcus]|uniref:hypothetical protein n=1 Tax=Rhodococcus TaxID=1827 RepID=UPI000A8EC9EF|nr:hypothetical protein [Rhodococcus koreensis]